VVDKTVPKERLTEEDNDASVVDYASDATGEAVGGNGDRAGRSAVDVPGAGMHVRAVPWGASGWGVDGRVGTGGRGGERGEVWRRWRGGEPGVLGRQREPHSSA